MMSDRKTEIGQEVSLTDIFIHLIKKWKRILLFILIGIGIVVLNYTVFLEKKYIAEIKVVANLDNNKIETTFGEYSLLSNDFNDYHPIFYDDKLIELTIDSLKLDSKISLLEFKSSLKFKESRGSDKKQLFPIVFSSTLPGAGEVLKTHLDLYILFLNHLESKRGINYFLDKKMMDIDLHKKDIIKTKKKIAPYDSLLNTIETIRPSINFFNNSNTNLKNKLELVNENYVEVEKKLINHKMHIFNLESEISCAQSEIDSLINLNRNLSISNFESTPFKVFDQLIKIHKEPSSDVLPSLPSYKKYVVLPILIVILGIILIQIFLFLYKKKEEN